MTTESSAVRAQDVFTAMLRDRVAPRLRERGFLGSGQTFELRDDRYWALLGFTRSRHSRADEVEFTATVAVVGKDDWAQLRTDGIQVGRRPAAGDVARAGALRLDELDARDRDTWWLVRPDTEPGPVADAVLAAVDAVALPWLHSRLRRAAAPHTLEAAADVPNTLLV